MVPPNWLKIDLQQVHKNTSLAWPMALNAVLLQSMLIIDLMLVAPLGEVSVAAMGIATALITLVVGIQNAIANATQLLLARAIGAGDMDNTSRQMAAGWTLNIGFTALVCLSLWLVREPLLALITDNPAIARQADHYILIALGMVLVSSVTQVMISYFNSNKLTRIPLLSFLIEMPCNILVSLVLIHGLFGAPALGLAGAAAGSLVAILVRLGFLLFKLRQQTDLDLGLGWRSISRPLLRQHSREAWPIAINYVTIMSGITLFQLLFAQLDVYEYAAITLINPWLNVGNQFGNAWAVATSIHVSQYLGRRETHVIPGFVRDAGRMIQLIGVLTALIFAGFSVLVPHVYPNIEDQTLQALALIAPAYIMMPLVRTFNSHCGNTLRALGDSFRVLRIHTTSMWCVGLPLCVVLLYLGAPVYLVFGTFFFQELLKAIPFWLRLRLQMNRLVDKNVACKT